MISEQQARSALLELCSSKCCYGSKAAQQMSIRHMNSTSAFHVRFSLSHVQNNSLPTMHFLCTMLSFYLRDANEAVSFDTFFIILTIYGFNFGLFMDAKENLCVCRFQSVSENVCENVA